LAFFITTGSMQYNSMKSEKEHSDIEKELDNIPEVVSTGKDN